MLLWQTWQYYFWEDWRSSSEFCTRKAISCSELSKLFCGSLEEKRLNTVNTRKAWHVKSEMEAKILPGVLCNSNTYTGFEGIKESWRISWGFALWKDGMAVGSGAVSVVFEAPVLKDSLQRIWDLAPWRDPLVCLVWFVCSHPGLVE